jgi:hypothetical protein
MKNRRPKKETGCEHRSLSGFVVGNLDPQFDIFSQQFLPSARLTHSRNLAFPASRAAPWDRGLFRGVGAATADESADSEE